MGSLKSMELCLDQLECSVQEGNELDSERLQAIMFRLQSLVPKPSTGMKEIVLIRPLPGDSTKRLSKRLKLEVAYDSSNSQMPLNILVMKAVENYRFNDLLTLSVYVGVQNIRQIANEYYDHILPRRLVQILRNIEHGLNQADKERALP